MNKEAASLEEKECLPYLPANRVPKHNELQINNYGEIACILSSPAKIHQ